VELPTPLRLVLAVLERPLLQIQVQTHEQLAVQIQYLALLHLLAAVVVVHIMDPQE
jgi:hypothetical protein